ncbi:MAG TPA: acyltransferase [Puia sp.]|uniref:acyltransferase family protein n=1 Tax=Puia sp. TaxID=2045100 RepID=UPI002B57D4AF|nr:acyltransferase [Puia sp.]HVU96934.1 acyltransferase [Puia sp.]
MKKMYLECVRGMAALSVFLFHLAEAYLSGAVLRRHSAAIIGSDSVIIFFILSGSVINISQSRKPRSRSEFFLNRLMRLWPQFLLGLLLGILVTLFVSRSVPGLGQILGNVFMLSTLQGFIAKSVRGNAAVWSLSYEMFFYLVFILMIGADQKRRMKGWLLVSLVMLPLCYHLTHIGVVDQCVSMLGFSAIWLVGYYVYEYRQYFYFDGYAAALSLGSLALLSRVNLPWELPWSDPFKDFLFALTAIPFFRYCLQDRAGARKASILFPAGVYLLLVTALVRQPDISRAAELVCIVLPPGIVSVYHLLRTRWLKPYILPVVGRLGLIFGKYSYSLYIGHLPVLMVCARFLPHRPVPYLLTSIPCVALLAYFMESHFQPAMVKLVRWVRAGKDDGQDGVVSQA